MVDDKVEQACCCNILRNDRSGAGTGVRLFNDAI